MLVPQRGRSGREVAGRSQWARVQAFATLFLPAGTTASRRQEEEVPEQGRGMAWGTHCALPLTALP